MDAVGQVGVHDDVCVGGTERRQGRSFGPPGGLLRQRPRSSLPQVWQQ